MEGWLDTRAGIEAVEKKPLPVDISIWLLGGTRYLPAVKNWI
jgi:hypothetical protein